MSRISTTLLLVALTLFACKSSTAEPKAGASGEPAAKQDTSVAKTPETDTPPAAADAVAVTEPNLEVFKGNYTLVLDPQSGWHDNAIQIDSIDASGAKGTVSIDWNIGPEARLPGPDEIRHTVPFQAQPKDLTLEFKASIGKLSPIEYAFKLHLCPASKDPACDPEISDPHLAGTAKKGPEELKAKATRAKTP